MSPIDIALGIAASGFPVFPCSRQKTPAISERDGSKGFHDATCDANEIVRMFSRKNAVLVGVPTGPASGFDVLDFDYRHGAGEWEQRNSQRLPESRTHQTMSGGRHLLFRHAPGVRNSASKKTLAPGMDVRGDGGYIIMPPSIGYSVISDADIAHWPDWLLPLVLPPPRPAAPPRQPGPRTKLSSERFERFKERALARVRNAAEGSKHFELRNMAILLGGVAEQADFTDEAAIRWLLDSLQAGVKDWCTAEATAAWGLARGRERSIDMPDKIEKTPDPRRKETAKAAFRMLRMGVPTVQILTSLHEQNTRRADPLPAGQIDETVLWAARTAGGAPC